MLAANSHKAACLSAAFLVTQQVHVVVFPLAELSRLRAGGAPLCWMWGQLVAAAHGVFGSEWTLLIGDDVHIEPANWAARLAGGLCAAASPPVASNWHARVITCRNCKHAPTNVRLPPLCPVQATSVPTRTSAA